MLKRWPHSGKSGSQRSGAARLGCGRSGVTATGAGAAGGRRAVAKHQSERWAWVRAHMPVTRHYAYMNCGWSGPLSTPVIEAMQDRLTLELAQGPTTRAVLDHRLECVERLRAGAARLVGADVDEIAITGNTTGGINMAVNGLRLGPGDGVVTSSVEHSGGIVPAYYLRRRGADLRIVPLGAADAPGEIVERFARAIDTRTRLVLLSEISYSTGQRLPLQEITALAHEHGAAVVVDGAQTAGHLPLDVHTLAVDAYAMTSHKWLCGPDGLGMLYVRRDRIPDLEPTMVGGRAAATYDFEGGFEPEREHVTKFEVSTVSPALIAGAAAAITLYLDSGPAAVWGPRARALPLRGRTLRRHPRRSRGQSPRRGDAKWAVPLLRAPARRGATVRISGAGRGRRLSLREPAQRGPSLPSRLQHRGGDRSSRCGDRAGGRRRDPARYRRGAGATGRRPRALTSRSAAFQPSAGWDLRRDRPWVGWLTTRAAPARPTRTRRRRCRAISPCRQAVPRRRAGGGRPA